jgi:hypothetical protein
MILAITATVKHKTKWQKMELDATVIRVVGLEQPVEISTCNLVVLRRRAVHQVTICRATQRAPRKAVPVALALAAASLAAFLAGNY